LSSGVGIPEEGFFDYCDQFLKTNPTFEELSDRKILDWCEKSGLKRNTQMKDGNSNDKPAFSFGLPAIDSYTVQKTLRALVPTIKRNLLIGELKGNLTEADRAEVLKLFENSCFKKTAHVTMGEPPKAFKEYQQAFMKKAKEEAAVEKQAFDEKKANQERVQKLNALKRKKAEEVRKRQIEKAKKKAEKEKKKALKAAQAKAAEAKKAALKRKKEADKKKKEAEKKIMSE
jgi:hypothetical protein